MSNDTNKLSLDLDLDKLTPEERDTFLSLTEKATAANQKAKRWKPNKYESYYFISDDTFIKQDTWTDHELDLRRFSLGNCFPTGGTAQFEVERRRITAELEIFALEHNNPVDWTDMNQWKFNISYNHYDKKIGVDSWLKHQHQGIIHFSSEEIAQAAIDSVGEDRIKKYLFNITE